MLSMVKRFYLYFNVINCHLYSALGIDGSVVTHITEVYVPASSTPTETHMQQHVSASTGVYVSASSTSTNANANNECECYPTCSNLSQHQLFTCLLHLHQLRPTYSNFIIINCLRACCIYTKRPTCSNFYQHHLELAYLLHQNLLRLTSNKCIIINWSLRACCINTN